MRPNHQDVGVAYRGVVMNPFAPNCENALLPPRLCPSRGGLRERSAMMNKIHKLPSGPGGRTDKDGLLEQDGYGNHKLRSGPAQMGGRTNRQTASPVRSSPIERRTDGQTYKQSDPVRSGPDGWTDGQLDTQTSKHIHAICMSSACHLYLRRSEGPQNQKGIKIGGLTTIPLTSISVCVCVKARTIFACDCLCKGFHLHRCYLHINAKCNSALRFLLVDITNDPSTADFLLELHPARAKRFANHCKTMIGKTTLRVGK